MNTQTRSTTIYKMATLLAVLVLTSAGCTYVPFHGSGYIPESDVTFGQDFYVSSFVNGSGPEIDVTIDQEALNNMASNSFLQLGDHCQDYAHVTGVEMKDGFIRINVMKDLSDEPHVIGLERKGLSFYFVTINDLLDRPHAQGNLDFTVGTDQGNLVIKITAVDVPGLSLTHPCVVESNRALHTAMDHMFVGVPGEVQFKEAVVENGALRMKIQVLLPN